MTKEERAEEYVRNKADKGNFDLEQFGKAYFSESSLKQAYLAAAEPRENRIAELEKACHKWFMRWREAKKDALYFDSRLQKQIEATYKVVEELNRAKEMIKKFSEFVNNEDEYEPEHPQEHTDLWNELCEKAERFLKELEICEERLCAYCDQYKSCPGGKRCRICDNGSKWRRSK